MRSVLGITVGYYLLIQQAKHRNRSNVSLLGKAYNTTRILDEQAIVFQKQNVPGGGVG